MKTLSNTTALLELTDEQIHTIRKTHKLFSGGPIPFIGSVMKSDESVGDSDHAFSYHIEWLEVRIDGAGHTLIDRGGEIPQPLFTLNDEQYHSVLNNLLASGEP